MSAQNFMKIIIYKIYSHSPPEILYSCLTVPFTLVNVRAPRAQIEYSYVLLSFCIHIILHVLSCSDAW